MSGKDSGIKMSDVQKDVEEVKGLMSENIEKVVERGESLKNLDEKAEDLEESSKTFKETSKKVKRKMCFRSAKMTACVIISVIFAILVIVAVIVVVILKPWERGTSGAKTTAEPSISPINSTSVRRLLQMLE